MSDNNLKLVGAGRRHSCIGYAAALLAMASFQCLAQEPAEPEACKGDLPADTWTVPADAGTQEQKADEIFKKVEEALPETLKIPRGKELRKIVSRLIRDLLEHDFNPEQKISKLQAGILAACTKLSDQPFDAAVRAAYEAAGMRVPHTTNAEFDATSDATSNYSFMLGTVQALEANGGRLKRLPRRPSSRALSSLAND